MGGMMTQDEQRSQVDQVRMELRMEQKRRLDTVMEAASVHTVKFSGTALSRLWGSTAIYPFIST
ncbi:hypothetical protein [Roseobacter sp. TSBP12]|uniref:hypothetical protein n=1 Tax=Roseobacter sp. TSBP12 TaxID=1236613 RepID=UPI00125FE591|nr:hypothetical protein [Roseobacter sp. TSBP12]KAB6717726.1 hypothetical protein C8029_04190 [Roseobacter sp. TSBP12]